MKQVLLNTVNYRNRYLGYSILGLSGILLPTFLSGSPKNISNTEKKQPNIIVIVADDLGWKDVGYHGSEIKTPNIDRMSQKGIQLNHFYVCSVCSPTRASLLTGKYPSRYGILSPLSDEAGLPAGTLTIAGLLKKNGYDTGLSGKWHLGAEAGARPMNYGFNSSYGYLRGQIDPYTHLYKNGNKTWHRNDVLIDEKGHATDLITEDAIKFISKPRDKSTPFFLYLAFSVPHTPLDESKQWTEMYSQSISNESRREFAAAVSHMDNGIGKILENLKDKGIENNTIILFLSDNGAQVNWSSATEYDGKFKPNDVLGNNLPLRDWKGSLYEGALRVPAIIMCPNKQTHLKIEEAINVADVFPTLAAFAGAKISKDLNLDGLSFIDAIDGKKKQENRIMYWKTNNSTALKKGEWKLIHNGKTLHEGTDELYNLQLDPYEMKDVSKENMQKVQELKKDMQANSSLDSSRVISSAKE